MDEHGIYKVDGGYKVRIYDQGYVTMCELKDGKWQDCLFPTYEDALKAKERYNECWKD